MIAMKYLPLGASYRQRLTEAACYLPVSELSYRSIEEYERDSLTVHFQLVSSHQTAQQMRIVIG